MVSVVLMAGQQPITKEYREMIERDYREHYHYKHDSYKPLKEFRARVDRKTFTQKPLIQFTMEKLENADSVDDIVIVGDQEKLEERLDPFIATSRKRYKIINQYEPLEDHVLHEFNVERKNAEQTSICANGLRGYISTEAYKNNDYALFMASDSPGTSTECIDEFIRNAAEYIPGSGIVFPFANMKELPKWRHAFHRKYLFLINDTKHKFKDGFRTIFTKRDGYRISSMLLADPKRLDLNLINTCYSLRKMLSPMVQESTMENLKKYPQFDAPSLLTRYLSGKLSIKEGAGILSKMLCRDNSKLTILPIRHSDSSIDYDGTIEDEGMIDDLLNGEHKSWLDKLSRLVKRAARFQLDLKPFPEPELSY